MLQSTKQWIEDGKSIVSALEKRFEVTKDYDDMVAFETLSIGCVCWHKIDNVITGAALGAELTKLTTYDNSTKKVKKVNGHAVVH